MAWIAVPKIDDTTPGFLAVTTSAPSSSFKIKVLTPDSLQGAIIKLINPITGEYILKNRVIYQNKDSGTTDITFTIDNTMCVSNAFSVGNTIQCQVRGVPSSLPSNVTKPTTNKGNAEDWLAVDNNAKAITPWSVSVLFNCTSTPTVTIEQVTLVDSAAQFNAKFSSSSDSLSWYQITNNGKTTDRIYPIEKNAISYALTSAATDAYTLTYVTKKGYKGSITGNIVEESAATDDTIIVNTSTSKASVNANDAKVTLAIVINNHNFLASKTGTVVISRSSAKSRFADKEVIATSTETLPAGSVVNGIAVPSTVTVSFTDYFAEPGVAYKYHVYFTHSSKKTNTWDSGSIIYMPEDMFLLSKDLMLRIKYNPEITGFKYNVQDSITPTLGGKYPVARRNGNQNYLTFTIGGLISYNTESGLDYDFSNSEFFSETRDYYSSDYASLDAVAKELAVEKLFREKVMAFLTNEDIKLFKSGPEGMRLVRLSNVSFSSNKALGRNIYSFTAQATEMEDCTIENCKKYVSLGG